MRYQRLTREQRYQIEILFKSKKGVREIARLMNRSSSTISRELSRNQVRTGRYKGESAHQMSLARRRNIGPPRKIRGELERKILKGLRIDWSPEQIIGRAKLMGEKLVSIETIYSYVYRRHKEGRSLRTHLRWKRPRRRSHQSSKNFKNIGVRKNRVWLEDRPEIVELRNRLGDLELDTVEGKKSGSLLLTIVDRTSRKTRIVYLETKNAKTIHEATVRALKNQTIHTITNDNGLEFAMHEATSKALKTQVYFTRPYRAWERGTNENTNGLIRQYCPKQTIIVEKQARLAEHRINNRPRKCLGFKTPSEVHRHLSRALR